MNRTRRRQWSISDFDIAKELREAGCSLDAIARQLEKPRDDVRDTLSAHGIEAPAGRSESWRDAAREWGGNTTKGWPRVPLDPDDCYDKHFDAIMAQTGNRGFQIATRSGRIWGMTGRAV